jgi:nitrite reductase/ring-hydroxylating ferredoxin subunit
MADLRFHPAATADELSDGDMKAVTIGKKTIALYNVGGSYYATDAFCSHGHALLTDGYIEGDLVECPMHGGTFVIATGAPKGEPCSTAIATYPVKVEGDDVSIGVTED